MLVAFYSTVFHPTVRDRAGARRYMAAVTLFAWMVAACIDAVQHAFERDGLAAFLWQEPVTLICVLVIAIPTTRTISLAHLDLHRARREAERLSFTDSLTGLANRRAFYAAAAEIEGGAIALAIADIDRFKRINDQHGHAAGDAALTAVAHIMRDELADMGLVARLGGEEFGLLSSDGDSGRLRERLQRFRQRVAEARIEVAGQTVAVTVSAGFAVRAHVGMDTLYSSADRALYVAKSAGRDRVVAFDEIEAALARTPLRQTS